jgi:DNA anti-recombination protein RmuC
VSGETYEIPHPDFILVPPKESYVVVIDSKDPKEAPNHISALSIERATPLDGQQRNTRKRS